MAALFVLVLISQWLFLLAGIGYIRREVCQFIEGRDGYKADPETIFLTDGATPAVEHILYTLISSSSVGVCYCEYIRLFRFNPIVVHTKCIDHDPNSSVSTV